MKRPIKFRGIAVDTGGMVYGSLIQEEHVSTIVYYANEEDEEPIFHRVIPETVGQFTGLLDKNGKEIFEADLFKAHYGSIYSIGFVPQLGLYSICRPIGNVASYPFSDHDRGEIIGNIHEHPELITS